MVGTIKLQCWDFDEDHDSECCSTCHGDNWLFNDDVRLTFTLKDGREAELCCDKIVKLIELGLLDEKYRQNVHV
jgi:hypothetical protein